MTMKMRRTFTDEFKREAVSQLEASGRPLMRVASELGLQPSMLRNRRAALHVAGASTASAARPGAAASALSAE